MPQGSIIVLTADRTLTAGYRVLLEGMLAASQTTTTPVGLFGCLLMPRVRMNGNGGRAPAPLGLRRIEAALLRDGFSRQQVTVADYRQLEAAIGSGTKIVGISTGEPTGAGMNSSTMTAVAGGKIYPQAMFERLLERVRQLVGQRCPGAKIVVGGPGAWQVDETARKRLGVHCVITGYAEENVAGIFADLLKGPAGGDGGSVAGRWTTAARIPAIRGPSTMGVVEISRGCGLGCSFCTIARQPMAHLPVETILADAQTNVAAGMSSIAALSEDFFRYGGAGSRANPDALIELVGRLRQIPRVRLIQIDHANIATVAQFTDRDLRVIRDMLVGDSGARYVWVNLGVETASGELLRVSGGGAKLGVCRPGEWGEFCAQQIRRLCRAGFMPLASLIIGLPEETDEQLRQTIEWVEAMRDEPMTIFPMLHAPLNGSERPKLHRGHWDLVRRAYRLNFRWIPRTFGDNQAAAGVGAWRRLLMQGLGRAQMLQWKLLFKYHHVRAESWRT